MTEPTPSTRLAHAGSRRVALVAAVVAGVALGYAAINLPLGNAAIAAESPATPAAPPPMPVTVAVAQARDVTPRYEFSGRLEAVGRVELRSRVAGYVEAVKFEPGSMVKKGDLLFLIDAKPFEAERARALAALQEAQARDSLARAELTRAKRLLDEQAIAQREYDARLHAQREAQAALAGAQAALETARLQLGYTRITAPISGRIGRAEITPGNLITAGASGPLLATIVSVSPIYASFDVDEQSLRQWNGSGQSAGVRMALAGDRGFAREGRIESIDNRLDPRSGTLRVRATFDNVDGALTPGQYARVQVPAAQRRAVLTSDLAVGTDQHKKFVYVVGDDGKVAWREVQLGASIDGLRIVEGGLEAGERVIVNGTQRVRPGMAVEAKVVGLDEAAKVAAGAARGERS